MFDLSIKKERTVIILFMLFALILISLSSFMLLYGNNPKYEIQPSKIVRSKSSLNQDSLDFNVSTGIEEQPQEQNNTGSTVKEGSPETQVTDIYNTETHFSSGDKGDSDEDYLEKNRVIIKSNSVPADINIIERINEDTFVAEISEEEFENLEDKKELQIFEDRQYKIFSYDYKKKINSGILWNQGFGGTGVNIAVLDTGIDSAHDSFEDKPIKERDFTGSGSNTDNNGHGTHMAGLIAGNTETFTGIAPHSNLLNAKVFDRNGRGTTISIAKGIYWSVDPDNNPLTDDGADIILMSFGGPYEQADDVIEDAISFAISRGVLIVAASGNCGHSGICAGNFVGVTYPGSNENVLTVGALDRNLDIMPYSGRELNNGRIKPEIVAPAENIESSALQNTYGVRSGTSLSAAIATGVAALLIEKYPSATPSQIKNTILKNAIDLGAEGEDAMFGWGMINANVSSLATGQNNLDSSKQADGQINNSNDYYTASTNTYQFLYDSNGNLVKDNNFYYEYNSQNQLKRVRESTSTGQIISEFYYDYEGQRVKKIDYINGSTKTTYYVDDNFIAEVSDSGTKNTVFYYASDTLVGRKDHDGTLYFYHPNHLGSTNIVTDISGNVVEETNYLPYGEVIEGGQSRFLFTGQEADKETGIMYYDSRYYSPTIMHFTQPDTMLPEIFDPQQLNRYSYTIGNPLKYVDATGHMLFAMNPGLILGESAVGYFNPYRTVFRSSMPYEQALRYSGAEYPPLPIDIDMPYISEYFRVRKYRLEQQRASEIEDLKDSFRQKYDEMSKRDFWNGPARDAGFRPDKKSRKKGDIKFDRQGRAVDDKGNKWSFDRKEGRFHKDYGDKYGRYENIDPDGKVRHVGRSKVSSGARSYSITGAAYNEPVWV